MKLLESHSDSILLTASDSLKGSFHKTIFSKYTEPLPLKDTFIIFWNYFWNILEIKVFQSKNVKNVVIFKNWGTKDQQTDKIVNNFLRWFVTEPRTYVKERRKQKQWMRPLIWKRDSKGAYYLTIDFLRSMDKEDFQKKICKKSLAAIPILLFCLGAIHKWRPP